MSKKRIFRTRFVILLRNLEAAIQVSLSEGREGNLFPALFAVYSYLWSANKARLKSNGNYVR